MRVQEARLVAVVEKEKPRVTLHMEWAMKQLQQRRTEVTAVMRGMLTTSTRAASTTATSTTAIMRTVVWSMQATTATAAATTSTGS